MSHMKRFLEANKESTFMWSGGYHEDRPGCDPSLPVLKELPEGYAEDPLRKGVFPRVAYDWEHKGKGRYHWCSQCAGWVPGFPRDRRVNNIGILSGRKGVASHCARCSYEIWFSGMIA